MSFDSLILVLVSGDPVEAWRVAVIEALAGLGARVEVRLLSNAATPAPHRRWPAVLPLSGAWRAGEADASALRPLATQSRPVRCWTGSQQLSENAGLVLDLCAAPSYQRARDNDSPVARVRFQHENAGTAEAAVCRALLSGSELVYVGVSTEGAGASPVVHDIPAAIDPRSWSRSVNGVLWKAASFVPRALTRAGPIDTTPAPSLPSPSCARGLAMLAARAAAARRLAAQKVSKALFTETWGIALSPVTDSMPSTERTAGAPVRWLRSEENLADPFLLDVGDETILFAERFSDGVAGTIVASWVDEQGAIGEPFEVLRRPYHLSYPFVFEDEGSVFMVPDSAASRTVTLYRAVDFPYEWTEHAMLLDGIVALDSTLHRTDTGYWLWTFVVPAGLVRNGELWLFHSDRLTGPWRAHPQNPVAEDPRNTRSAGRVFKAEGRLMRPAQDCLQRYGRRIVLNEITILDRHQYRETPVCAIEPEWARGLVATHTITRSTRWQALDGARRVPRWHG